MSFTPTRRSLIKAGAWTAPAIVLATAAPATAVSGSGRALILALGSTRIEHDGLFSTLRYDGFTITPDSAIPAAGLVMTVTNPGRFLFQLGTPSGWALTSSSPGAIVYSRAASSAAGETVAVPNGVYFDDEGVGGSFVLSFTAPDHDLARVSFAIPARRDTGAVSPRDAARARERQATS
ncbi:hypothetical protein [Nocardioides sp.]|uniref:hypothetical protein n=1 Tax=Nocardioides sp. TaxID=35761 RepID=UPI002B26BC26|nr:hypothetical protein [Nocardioides sp.]